MFSPLGNRSVCCHCSLQRPLGKFHVWHVRALPGKRRKWVRDPRALLADRMRYSHSYILIFFFFAAARERKDIKQHRG